VVASLPEALAAAGDAEIAFVIGGAELYRQALPLADRLVLTEIDQAYDGDAFFPEFDRNTWHETAREPRVAESGLPFAFVTYERQG
jgi:dihydrofolate reductase